MKIYHYDYKVRGIDGVTVDSAAYCTNNDDVEDKKVEDFLTEDIEDTFYGEIVDFKITKVERQ